MKENTFPTWVLGDFDIVVHTQDEFDTLIESPTWLHAKSVCFVGDGGTLKFIKKNTGLLIPLAVEHVRGIDNAIIEVVSFEYNAITNKAALWHGELPSLDQPSIRDITVNCIADMTDAICFYNCHRLTSCTGTSISTDNHGISFRNCTQLTNCTGSGTGANDGYGFINCDQLIDCTSNGTSISVNGNGHGFRYCTQLTNCTGTSSSDNSVGYGFSNCTQLTNCTGKNGKGNGGFGLYECDQLNNCIGIGYNGYGFSNCHQLTRCTGIGIRVSNDNNSSDVEELYGYGFHKCTRLINCTGTGAIAHVHDFGFIDCSDIINCTDIDSDINNVNIIT